MYTLFNIPCYVSSLLILEKIKVKNHTNIIPFWQWGLCALGSPIPSLLPLRVASDKMLSGLDSTESRLSRESSLL